MMRGPYLSTIMPMIILAGIVSATFMIRSALTSCWDNPNVCWIEAIKGAWLNQTKKLMKNANQVRCSVRIFPLNENRLSLCVDIIVTFASLH